MRHSDAADIWKLFKLNWTLVLGCALALIIGLLLTDFRIQHQGYLIIFSVAALYGASGYYNYCSERKNPRIYSSLTAIAQIIFVIATLNSLSYIAASANFPLRDSNLLAFDKAIGFDFRYYLGFVNDRAWLVSSLAFAYRAIHWELPVVILVLTLGGFSGRASQYVFAFTVSFLITICISTLIPAIGTYGVLGLTSLDFPNIMESDDPNAFPGGYSDTLRTAPLLRDGTLRTLDFFTLSGVLTFPSFHAVSAILYAWALWPIHWLRPFNLLTNGLMIVATPIGGGHFLVDVLAGILIATIAIFSARIVANSLSRSNFAERSCKAQFC